MFTSLTVPPVASIGAKASVVTLKTETTDPLLPDLIAKAYIS
jgi:hypothetical protein